MILSRSSNPFLLLSLALAGLLFLVGCDSLFGTDEDTISEDARIVFGEHIEGVRLGDDSLTVVQKLGVPTGIGVGDFEGWRFLYYEGNMNRAEVTIFDYPSFSGVTFMCVYPPYDGKTRDGVGIGTSRSEALEKLGPPTSSEETDQRIRDDYRFEEARFSVEYQSEEIFSICMRF